MAPIRAVKSSVLLFQGVFSSGPSGVVRVYLAADDARRLFGQASNARVSIVTTTRTANAQLVLKFYDTAGTARPTALDSQYAPFQTSSAFTTSFPAPFNVTGPFCDNVDVALEVSASTGSQIESWQGAIYATLAFD